jgi:hypothetical protein
LDLLAANEALPQQLKKRLDKARRLTTGKAAVAFVHGAGNVGLGQTKTP